MKSDYGKASANVIRPYIGSKSTFNGDARLIGVIGIIAPAY